MITYNTVLEWNEKQSETLFSILVSQASFLNIDPDLMEAKFIINYGSKTMPSNIYNLNVNLLADILLESNYDKWQDLVDVTKTGLESGDLQTTTNSKIINSDVVGSNNSINKVSSFNGDDLINDSGSDGDNTLTTDTTETTTQTINKHNFNTVNTNLLNYDKTNIMTVVSNDIINFISHSIY